MSQPIIEVRNLSKRYRLGAIGATSLREEVNRYWDRLRGVPHPDAQEFWALRDVSFDVQQGEIVGVIGRNGAGKSTLLKILSRITEPTSGYAKLRGRVASLLEVGTGFHPELTGRDNVYLNGAILGMNRAEVRSKFDEIVAFAEVEQFIDTPVKRYSSGMYVRLAFAVAAHLEPEILIVDEVLAVGDVAFQQKCLQKIKAISASNRTVLFVSHSLATLRTLCDRGILLEHGEVSFNGQVRDTIERYISTHEAGASQWVRSAPLPSAPGMYFRRVVILNSAGMVTSEIGSTERFCLELDVVANDAVSNVQLAIRFTNGEGIPAFTTCNTDVPGAFVPFAAGTHRLRIDLDANVFMPGRYTLKIAAHVPQERLIDLIEDRLNFTIHDSGSHTHRMKDNRLGVLSPLLTWRRDPA